MSDLRTILCSHPGGLQFSSNPVAMAELEAYVSAAVASAEQGQITRYNAFLQGMLGSLKELGIDTPTLQKVADLLKSNPSDDEIMSVL